MKIKTKILALFLITVFSLGVAACTAQDNKKTFDYQISHQEDYPKNLLNVYQGTKGRPDSYLLAIVFFKKNSQSHKLENSIVDAFESNKKIKTLYIDITDGFPDYLKSSLDTNWIEQENSKNPFALIFYNGDLRKPIYAAIFSNDKIVEETKKDLLDMSDLNKRVHEIDVANGYAEEPETKQFSATKKLELPNYGPLAF